jgi:multidrug resistance efflux pump
MDSASPLPITIPARSSVVARTTARLAPLVLIMALTAFFFARNVGLGGGSARGFSEAIPLNVSSAAGGRMIELRVGVGQAVKTGDIIAKLDSRPFELERQRVLAERSMLEAKLLAETSKEEDSVTRAEVWRLRTFAGAQQDQAALAALDKEIERLNGLLEDQLVKASDVEPLLRQRDALAARVESYERAKAAGRAGLDGKPTSGRPNAHAGAVQVRTAPLREALTVNKAVLDQIDFKIGTLVLRAPADGYVSTVGRRPGELLAPNEPAVVIVAHRPGVFEIYIPARDQKPISVGTTALISRAGLLSRSARGRVIEVSPTVVEMPPRLRSSPQVPLWGRLIRVDASDSEELRALPPGEEVRIRL